MGVNKGLHTESNTFLKKYISEKKENKNIKVVFICRKKMSLPVFRQSSSCAHPPEEILLPGSRTPGGIEPVTQPVHTVTNPLSTYFLDRKNLKKIRSEKKKKEPHEI